MGGYLSTRKPEIPSLAGRVAVVTGGNLGIGRATVLSLAQSGAKVYLGARTEEKFKIAIKQLHDEGLGENAGEIVWLELDLTYPQKAKAAAEFVISQEKRLDILINNAGKQITSSNWIEEGFIDSVVINHLGPFVFTNTLLPLLKSTARLPGADVRIVNVASSMHSWIKRPKFDSVEDFRKDFSELGQSKMQLYSYTKLANILHAKELQKRLDAENVPIIVLSLHPGGVHTEGTERAAKSWPLGTFMLWLFSAFILTPEWGSYTSLFAATSPIVRANPEKYKGAYLVPYGKIGKPNANARNEQFAKDLWETSEKALGVYH